MNFSRLTAFLDKMQEERIPGIHMRIDQNGKTIYEHMTGWSDRENGRRIRGDEIYWLYSASKVVTCAAALTLYEKGAFLLHDPVKQYLPAFSQMQVREIRHDGQVVFRPARMDMTIRHLFTMTSGLDYDLNAPEIRECIASSNGKAPTLNIVNAIAQKPLLFDPGTHFTYGLSHDVLAAVVEVISGERFGGYVRKNIFEPCGMVDSYYHLQEADPERVAKQYRYSDEEHRALLTDGSNDYVFGSEYESGGAGMLSTLNDYMKFIRMLCRGGVTENGYQVLSRRTIDLMRTDHLGADLRKDFDWPHFKGYGYGLGVRTMVDRTESGSTGPVGEYGWAGAAGAYVLIDPENQLTAYYAQHMLNNQEPYMHPRLRNIIYACID